MQVFNAFMKILRKKLFFAVLVVGIFLGISIPASLSSGNSSSAQAMFKKEAKSSVSICIFDEDNTPESKAFANYLSGKYTVKKLKNDNEVIIDSLYYMNVDSVITIDKGYSQKLSDGETDSIVKFDYMHDSIHIVLLENDINSYFSAASAYIAGGENVMSASQKAADALSAEADVNVVSFESEEIAEYPMGFSIYFRYMVYSLVASVIGTLCPVLIIMNRKEVRFRTNCSSIRPSSYTKQIFLGGTIFVIGVWLIFIAAGVFMYGGIFKGRAWFAVLNSFILAMNATSISVLISLFCTNLNIVTFVNQIVSLGMCFLCGVFVEQELMSEKVLAFARFLPAYWYIKANLMLNGTEVFDSAKLAQYMLIEAAFAVVIALLAILINKVRYTSPAIISGTKPVHSVR
jgi:ABC-2 type transport system permease protein